MSKYSDASFILPQGAYRKAGEIELLKPTDNLLNLKVSRNAPCDEINSLGESVEVAADVPRYDFKAPYVPPVDNSNYSFGTGAYGTLPNPTVSPVTSPYSNILKFKTGSDITTFQVIDSISFDANNRLSIGVKSGYFVFTTYNGTTSNSVNYPVLANTVYEFGVSKDSTHTQKEIYLSGVLVPTTTAIDLTTYSTTASTIGNSSITINGFLGNIYSTEPYNLEQPESYFLDRYNGLPIPEKYKRINNIDIVSGFDITNWEELGCTALTSNSFISTVANGAIRKIFDIKGETTYRAVYNGSIDIGTISLVDGFNVSYSSGFGEIEFTTGVFTGGKTNKIGFKCSSDAATVIITEFTLYELGNTLDLSTGKTDSTWYDREHDIQAVMTGTTLNDSTDFGNNFHGVKTCPSLLTEPLFKNYYFNSRTPVSQTVTGLTVGETYTVNCKGAGIITISETGGSGQGGSATEVYSYTYIATQTSVVITLEAGHSFDWVMVTDTAYPMNHIETLGASITKPVDAVTGGGDVNTFNSLEGTFVVSSSSLSNSSNIREVAINDGTGSNRVGVRYSSIENKVEFVFVVSSATVYFYQHTLLNDSTDENTFRIDYKGGLFISYVNNIEVDRQDSGLVPPADTFNQLTLGGSEPYIARTNFIQYYKEI